MKSERIEKAPMLPLHESVLYEGDALTVLQRLPSESVQCAVTSPPYWGLRDYNNPDQIGLEETMPQFINRLCAVFSEMRRVLRPDGVFWLNIGDGYTSGNRGWRAPDKKNPARAMDVRPGTPDGLKSKDLLGIPWRLAFALHDDGWYLRADLVCNKPNAMPESVKDRTTRAHEYIFMLTSIKEFTEKGFTISRKTMASVAKDEFPKMTEERIRKKADDLQELGLITKSVGRIGMRLTLNGLKYVTMFNQLTPINTRIKPLS